MGVFYTVDDTIWQVSAFTNFRFNILRVLTDFIHTHCRKQYSSILDIGCGSGIYALYFLSKGLKGSYLGIDISKKFTEDEWIKFSSLPGRLKIKFSALDAVSLSETIEDMFDFCVCIAMLEHVKHYRKVILQIGKVMRTGGYVLIIVPSKYTWLFSAGKHGYHFFSQDTIAAEAKLNDLTLIQTERIGGVPGYIFDLCFSWIASILYKFTDATKIFLRITDTFGGKYRSALQIISKLDKKMPFLETGYAYVFKRN